MIASVAAFNPVEVERVARRSYALTLWCFLQRQENERFSSLVRERDDITLAAMIAVGMSTEPKKLLRFEQEWRTRAMGAPAPQESREEMARRADELFAQHAAAMRKNPVS